jgi:hypothetical protein
MSVFQLCNPQRLGFPPKKRKVDAVAKSLQEIEKKHGIDKNFWKRLDNSPKRSRTELPSYPKAKKLSSRMSFMDVCRRAKKGTMFYTLAQLFLNPRGFGHIVESITSCMTVDDGIRLELLVVIERQLMKHLDSNRIAYTAWCLTHTEDEQAELLKKVKPIQVFDMFGNKNDIQCCSHIEYADMEFSNNFRMAVQSDQVKSMKLIYERRIAYWSEQGWRDSRLDCPRMVQMLNDAVLFVIRKNRRFMFQALMDLTLPSNTLWLETAVAKGRIMFIRELVNRYSWPRREVFATQAPNVEVLSELKQLNFPMIHSVVTRSIRAHEHAKLEWFLQNDVREKPVGDYLKTAIQVADLRAVEILFHFQYVCSTEHVQQALLSGDTCMVETIYRHFFHNQTCSFSNDIEHINFLRTFLKRMRQACETKTEMKYFQILVWMERHWWSRDLSSELLYSQALRDDSLDDFQMLYRHGIRAFLPEHMDMAILLDDSTFMNILLEENVSPTQFGMLQLKRRGSIHRLIQLARHRVCRHIHLQPLLNDLSERQIKDCMTRQDVTTSPGQYSMPDATPMNLVVVPIYNNETDTECIPLDANDD